VDFEHILDGNKAKVLLHSHGKWFFNAVIVQKLPKATRQFELD
jgi:hypothetical protein